MWSDPDEARSDFVLAAAAAVFGSRLLGWLAGLVPSGTARHVVLIVVVFATTGLVPLLLARYRREGVAAFGLDAPLQRVILGILLATPIFAVVVLQTVVANRAAGALIGGTTPDASLRDISALEIGAAAVYGLGTALLYTFLSVKARDGFRPVEMKLLAALRMYGMGAAGVLLLCGLLLAVAGQTSVLYAVLVAAMLALTVVLADRMVDSKTTTPRVAVLAPAIVALVIALRPLNLRVLVLLLFVSMLSAGTVLVASVLVQTRRSAWAGFGLLFATSFVQHGALSLLLLLRA